MQKSLFIVLAFYSFIPAQVFGGPNLNSNLPAVGSEANRVIQETKKVNPLADCFSGSMFTSQSPKTSAQQISSCVSRKINNLPDIPLELKEKVKDIPNMGWQELLKLKKCFNSFDAMKECSPTYQLLNHNK